MKIAQVHTGRVNNALGGTEKVFFEMANALSERGNKVGCFYYDTTEGAPMFKVNSGVYQRNSYCSLRASIKKTIKNIRACFILDKKKRQQVRKLKRDNLMFQDIKSFKPDIIILYWPDTIINKLIKLNIPIVLMMHMPVSFFTTRNYFHSALPAIGKCDCIQVLMSSFIPETKNIVKNDNVICIPNIVPQYETLSDRTSRTIVYIGRLSTEKRPWLLVEAFTLLKDRYPDWKVEMWGESHIAPEITRRVQTIIQNNQLEQQVTLCGTTLNPEEKLQNASIFAMTSSFECFSLSLTEAMSKGLPSIVCKDCISCCELVRHESNGLQCKPTAEDIALQLSKLMDSHELRNSLGNQAHEDMKAYNANSILNQWTKLLKELIQRSTTTTSKLEN